MSIQSTLLNTPADLLGSPDIDLINVRETDSFDYIPFIGELLPQYKGMPGYVYAQVCTQTLVRAESEGWEHLSDRKAYTIQGPAGKADMYLLTRGNRIPGQSPDAGARIMGVDNLVEQLTGLKIPELGKSKKETPSVSASAEPEPESESEPAVATAVATPTGFRPKTSFQSDQNREGPSRPKSD